MAPDRSANRASQHGTGDRGLGLIVAIAKNGVIGRDGGLPWRLPEDMRHFKEVTMGHAVIMGRATHESIGRPLSGRRNIVVTRTRDAIEGCEIARSLPEALALAYTSDPFPIVIGGAQLYAEALPQVTCIYLTEIDGAVEGDTHFPPFERSDFEEIERHSADETEGVWFVTLERRRASS